MTHIYSEVRMYADLKCCSCRFFSKNNDFTSPRYMAKFPVPGYFLLCWADFMSNREQLVTTKVGIPLLYCLLLFVVVWFIVCCHGSYAPHIVRTIGCFLSLVACMAPSDNMKESPQREGNQDIFSLVTSEPYVWSQWRLIQ